MKERRIGIRELKSKLNQCVRDVKMGAAVLLTATPTRQRL